MLRYRQDICRYFEAGLVGLFFVQAVRFLYGTLYAHIGSVDQLSRTVDPASAVGIRGYVSPGDLQIELALTVIALLAPLLGVVLGRWRMGTLVALVVAVGRFYMTFGGRTLLGVSGALVAAGGAALYAAILARRRPSLLPVMFVIGFGVDQMMRVYGHTFDPSWDGDFLGIQAILSITLFVLVLLNLWFEREERRQPDYQPPPVSQISGWGALALGGLFYLEFVVLALPNSLARHAGVDLNMIAPWAVGATLLPLVPEVRELARRFLGMFDGQWRGWVWFLLTGLLLVLGFRFTGPVSAVAFIVAQFLVSLSWWWLVQPSEGRGNFSGAAMSIGLIVFLALSALDYFTYDYAYVRGLPDVVETGLRSLRGLGLGVAILATLFVNLPAILARKRLPWRGGHFVESVMALSVVVLATVLTFAMTRPVIVIPPTNTDRLRVATLNLHGGYSQYYDTNLPEIAKQILDSGVDVVLLQEVETGRMISSGVDQAAWLGQALGMQVDYFPTNEALQGIAVLTRTPIEAHQGLQLSSIGKQTGAQWLRLRTPDNQIMDVYNTQLGLLLRDNTRSPELQQQDQLRQVEEIFGLMSQNDPGLNNRTLFGGTFNNTPGSDLYQRVAQYFSDPFANFAAEKAVTWRLLNGVTSRVDYPWLRKVTSLSAGNVETTASTHNMPVVEIQLGPPTGN